MVRVDARLRRQQLLECVLSGKTLQQAAAEMRISVRSALRYLADPEVSERLAHLQDERLQSLAMLGLDSGEDAMRMLIATFKDERHETNVRVRAARFVLQLSLDLHESVLLARRVQELEDREPLTAEAD